MIGTINKLPRWLILELAFPLAVLNGWLAFVGFQYFRSLITIFVIAALLAFVLNYPARLLQERGIKRNSAILLIFLLALLIALTFAATLAPALLEELEEFADRLPSLIESASNQLQAVHAWAVAQNLPIDLSRITTQLQNPLPSELQNLPDQILVFALDAVDSLLDVIVTLVLTFYLLLHGENLWNGLFQWLPTELGSQVRQSLQQNFQNYFIGQVTLASLMGLAVTTAFLLLRVPFGLIFGLGIGIMVLIPFGDVLGIGLVTLLVGLQNIWLGAEVLIAALIIDQIVDNGIAPRLLGNLIGLNPVWVIVALLVGAKIGGVLGLIIAVPLAGSIKNIADHLRVSTAD